jgi:hypothetical protein
MCPLNIRTRRPPSIQTLIVLEISKGLTACPKTREHLGIGIRLSNFCISAFQAGPDLVKWQEKNPHIRVCQSADQLFHRTGREAEAFRATWKMDQKSIVLYLARKRLGAVAIHDDLVATLGAEAINSQLSFGNTLPPRSEIGHLQSRDHFF